MKIRRYRTGSGMLRTTEALLAATTIVTALIIAASFQRSPSAFTSKYETNLEKEAYDILDTFAVQGVPDAAMFNPGGSLKASPMWEQAFKVTLQGLLPKDIVYNFEVYNITYNRAKGTTSLLQLNTISISNAASDKDFVEAGKVATAFRVYTCGNLWVLSLRLSLVEEGGR